MRRWKQLIAAAASVCLIFSLLSSPSAWALEEVAEMEQTTEPSEYSIFIYHQWDTDKQIPSAVYVNGITAEGTIARVYNSASGGRLLGEGEKSPGESVAVVTLKNMLSTGTGSVYVSLQSPGKSESSRTRATYSKPVTPQVLFTWYQYRSNDNLPVLSTEEQSQTYQTSELNLTEGSYCKVEIGLKQFTALNTLTLPLHYNTDYLELAQIKKSGSKYLLSPTEMAYAPDGLCFDFSTAANLKYGILAGTVLGGWTLTSSNGGEYQYVNTDTGVVKFDAYTRNGAQPLDQYGVYDSNWTQWSNQNQVVLKLYFRVKQDTALCPSGTLLRFATEDDCPEDMAGSASLARKYYDIANPNGLSATIETANVLMPCPVAEVGEELPEGSSISFSEADLAAPAQAYRQGNLVTSELLSPDQIKVYNYANSSSAASSGGAVDAQEDRLVLKPSNLMGGIQDTDRINVDRLLAKGGYERIVSVAQQDLEAGEVSIPLGIDELEAEGGDLYLSITRFGSGGNWRQESNRIRISYPAEVRREIGLHVYTSGTGSTEAPLERSLFRAVNGSSVTAGERLQLRISFRDISDLVSCAMAVRFNPAVVQASDRYFRPSESGTLTEDDFYSWDSGLESGEGLAPLTFNEWMICWGAETGNESAVKHALSISSQEIWEQRLAAAQEKRQAFEAEQGGSGARSQWKGGLVFDSTEALPSLDNQEGRLSFLMAAMSGPLPLIGEGSDVNVLTVYFTAVGDGDPGFYLEEIPGWNGVLQTASAAGEPSSVSFVERSEESELVEQLDRPELVLESGNARTEDAVAKPAALNITDAERKRTAVYLYMGYGFRDPGILLRGTNGDFLDPSQVTRYIETESGSRVELPAYTSDEAIREVFSWTGQSGLSTYELHYEYVDPLNAEMTASAVRAVIVVPERGDVNADGKWNSSDLTALAAQRLGIQSLTLGADAEFRKRVMDLNQDGTIDQADETLLDQIILTERKLQGDYPADRDLRVMLF